MKKSKAEELNDIFFQPKDQHLDPVQEKVLTVHEERNTILRNNKEMSQSLEELKVLYKLTPTPLC